MANKIILYSNNCPKCKLLKARLDNQGVNYELCTDIDLMAEKGFMSMPMFEVDGKVMDFNESIKWIMTNG